MIIEIYDNFVPPRARGNRAGDRVLTDADTLREFLDCPAKHRPCAPTLQRCQSVLRLRHHDEDITALIAEALISIESAEVGLDLIIAPEGAKPEFLEAKTRLARAKEALGDLGKPAKGANG